MGLELTTAADRTLFGAPSFHRYLKSAEPTKMNGAFVSLHPDKIASVRDIDWAQIK